MARRLTVSIFVCAAALFAVLPASAGGEARVTAVLFAQPLHITRRVEDSLARRPATIEEYCVGNRIVSAAGARVTIVDYALQQVTEIDRVAGTYSITGFESIAAAQPVRAGAATAFTRVQPRALTAAMAAPSSERAEFEDRASGRRLAVAVDRSVILTREAAEALIGSSYPRARGAASEAILSLARQPRQNATAASTSTEVPYALPSEQIATYDAGGISVTLKSSVTRVGNESVPPQWLVMDPAWKRVESSLVRASRELREADQLPSQPQQ